MTRTVRPENEVQMLKPDYVSPLVGALCSEKPPANGQLYECGSGYFAATRWQRARGVDFPHVEGVPAAEAVFKVSCHVVATWQASRRTDRETGIPRDLQLRQWPSG
jgi:hypothetical protein